MGTRIEVMTAGSIADSIVEFINCNGKNTAKIVGEVRKSNKKELRTIIHKPYGGNSIDFVGYSN